MSYIRTLGSFLYASLISLVYLWLSVLTVTKSIVYANGFWHTLFTVLGFVFLFSWISERGIQYLSIPFNWLWDITIKTRIATAIPVAGIGLWCIAMPLQIPITLTFGDWVLVSVWEILSVVFFYNLLLLPFRNTDMGVH